MMAAKVEKQPIKLAKMPPPGKYCSFLLVDGSCLVGVRTSLAHDTEDRAVDVVQGVGLGGSPVAVAIENVVAWELVNSPVKKLRRDGAADLRERIERMFEPYSLSFAAGPGGSCVLVEKLHAGVSPGDGLTHASATVHALVRSSVVSDMMRKLRRGFVSARVVDMNTAPPGGEGPVLVPGAMWYAIHVAHAFRFAGFAEEERGAPTLPVRLAKEKRDPWPDVAAALHKRYVEKGEAADQALRNALVRFDHVGLDLWSPPLLPDSVSEDAGGQRDAVFELRIGDDRRHVMVGFQKTPAAVPVLTMPPAGR